VNEIAKGIAWGEFHQHVYAQLLRKQIPKVQKDSQITSVFLRSWDHSVQKLIIKRWCNWHQEEGIFVISPIVRSTDGRTGINPYTECVTDLVTKQDNYFFVFSLD